MRVFLPSFSFLLAACAAPAPTPPAAGGLDQPLLATFNEPFWQLAIEGRELVFRGVDVEPERRLQLADEARLQGQRRLRAIDGQGTVELRIWDAPCSDSMSGAAFPYSAAVRVDGGDEVGGCARPASMPAPGEGG